MSWEWWRRIFNFRNFLISVSSVHSQRWNLSRQRGDSCFSSFNQLITRNRLFNIKRWLCTGSLNSWCATYPQGIQWIKRFSPCWMILELQTRKVLCQSHPTWQLWRNLHTKNKNEMENNRDLYARYIEFNDFILMQT